MKKFFFRLTVIAVLGFLTVGFELLIAGLEKEFAKPRNIIFEEPIPQQILDNWRVPSNFIIEKIVVAGFFSDWNPEDERYEMRRVSPVRWELEVPFDPGDNQYKFVIHIRGLQNGPVWSQDVKSDSFVSDSFGGWNSVARVPSVGQAAFVGRVILYGLICILLLLALLDPLIRLIMRLPVSLQVKMTLSFILIAVIFNIGIVFYNMWEQREFVKQGIIDGVNIVHNAVIGQGVDLNNISSTGQKEKMNEVLRMIFKNIRARIEKTKYSNVQTTLSMFVFFDTNLKPVSMGLRDEDYLIRRANSLEMGPNTTDADYLEKRIFAHFLERIREKTGMKREFWFDRIPDVNIIDTAVYRQMAGTVGFEAVFCPVYHKTRLAGYYGATFQVELFGSMLQRILFANLLFVIIGVLLAAILLMNIGGIVTASLNSLIDWTKDILKGNFDTVRRIETRDEIEKLAVNFDRMRYSLGQNIRNLRLMNSMTARLQTIKNIDELYFVFLSFITADFGFSYNRAAVFLDNSNGTLRGAYAVGYLDRNELVKKFGSVENYENLHLNADDFFDNYRIHMQNIDSLFLDAVKAMILPPESNTALFRTLQDGRPRLLNALSSELIIQDRNLAALLHLDEFLILPLYRGRLAIGVLLVDNFFNRRVISEENINQLQILLNEFAVTLENATLVENLENTVEKRTQELKNAFNIIKMDLNIARNIQKNILPLNLKEIRNLHFATRYVPQGEIGGDFYDIAEIRPNFVRILLADATGHGVQGALITMIIKTEYEKLKTIIREPSELFEILNNEFLTIYKNLTVFFSAILVDIDLKNNRIFYCSAGHCNQYFIDGDQILRMESTGKMIGVEENVRFREETIDTGSTFRLMLFTDGLTEEFNMEGREFGEAGLMKTIRQNARAGIDQLVENCLNRVFDYMDTKLTNDDITIIGIEKK